MKKPVVNPAAVITLSRTRSVQQSKSIKCAKNAPARAESLLTNAVLLVSHRADNFLS